MSKSTLPDHSNASETKMHSDNHPTKHLSDSWTRPTRPLRSGTEARAHRINRDICLTLSDEGISPVDFWLRFKEAAEIIGASHK